MNNCIGQLIITQEECADSMAWARSIIDLARDGTVLIARTLNQARGRQGRRWVTAEGQITHTIILKPDHFTANEETLATLNMAITLGILQPLKQYNVVLKWPNDFYLENKKLGGVLFENIWHENNLVAIIVGYSLNINNSCIDNQELAAIATSLTDTYQKKFDSSSIQTELFKSLSHFYNEWKQKKYTDLFIQWRQAQHYIKKSITVHPQDGAVISGEVQDILANGDLLLQDSKTNSLVTISFAQINEVKI